MTRRQAGLGLIEILVAMLVFAVGLLGLAAVQVVATSNGLETTQRSIATGLARDIIERMRSNPQQLAAYALDNAGPAPAPAHAVSGCARLALADGGGFRCTPAALADHDLAEWLGLLAGAAEVAVIDGADVPVGGLLEPRACIRVSAGRVSVAIAWRGQVPMASSGEDDCGAGSGGYGAEDELRRLLLMQTWIGRPGPETGA